ncbi:MAG: hypothetical protein ACJAV6_000005 [Candidatus Paceibacteria bacterium]|jgi:hypothetical protein
MKFFKKSWACEKSQMKKPETRLGIGIMLGLLIGIAMDDIGLGLAFGVVFGVSSYSSTKKKIKEDLTTINESK